MLDCPITGIRSGKRPLCWYGLPDKEPLHGAFITAVQILDGALVGVGAEAFRWPADESPETTD
jgi:hypothetical protein